MVGQVWLQTSYISVKKFDNMDSTVSPSSIERPLKASGSIYLVGMVVLS